ncbi:uncharacterized protein DFL_009300 [Arthrobotrys flagrans]|uniref:Nephrocystin 3-like N-terminal domain-containing protein n=1 Tax=Arthrobotrys flagrans TaxID=97331 RepID=A0A436ZRQ4_ARTFL|nr:hypothetical protein DFL_009300 [Arthrobotrys flagrans]
MSFSNISPPQSGTPIILPHGYLPYGGERRHSYSSSDLDRVGTERRASVDTTWEPSWGERPRSSGDEGGFFPPTPVTTGPQSAAFSGFSPIHRQSSMPTDASLAMFASVPLDYPNLLRQWLTPIDFQLERLQLQKTRADRTFEWLVTVDGQFTRWVKSNSPDSAVLWLCDRPGVGKSVATSLILQAVEIHCHSEKLSFAYIFGKRANKLNPAPQAIDFIKSLAFQIFRSHPTSGGHAPQGWETYSKYGSQIPAFDQAVEFLGEVLKNRKTYLVVDGIDECFQPSEVLEAILGLPTVADGTTRVLISSRMRPDAFDPDGLYPVIRLTPQQGVYSADLRYFVEDEVRKIEGFHRTSERFTEAVAKVIAASDGNFLWASALLADLKVAQVQGRFWETITTIPMEIRILVKQELWKIWQKPESKRRLTLEVLEWTIFCMEPLSVGSFPFGRHFGSDGSFLDYEHRRIDRSRFLLRFGTEFLVFPTLDGKFELFHHRLADYILLTSMEENPQFQLTDGPTRLALSCVRYLSSSQFQDSLNSETYQYTAIHSSEAGAAKVYLRSKYLCLEYSSRHLVHHLLKVSDVTTEDGSELVSALITFFLSTNATTWVEAGQAFDSTFSRSFINSCPELLDWIRSVVAVHPRWRESLQAVTARLEGLKAYASSSRNLLVRPQVQNRPRSATYESPVIQVSSYHDDIPPTAAEPRRPRSRSPRSIGNLLTSLSSGREESSRSPQRRTREEVEQGVQRRSPARSTFPIANNEIRRSSAGATFGAITSAIAIANVSATSAIPLQYHYPVRDEPCSSWGATSQPYYSPHEPPQFSHSAFGPPNPARQQSAPQRQQYASPQQHQQQYQQQQPYPMQEYYGPTGYPQDEYTPSEPPPPYMRYA